MFFILMESAALALTCSLDAFTAGFAYGSKRIRISFLSTLTITLTCSVVIGMSLFAGAFVRGYLSDALTMGICFAILFFMGFTKLLDSITKSVIRKHNKHNREKLNKEIKFSMFNFSFILSLYANPEEADINEDKVISPGEAAALAVSLSLDGSAVGFGAALGDVSVPVVILASIVANALAVWCGCRLGGRLSRTLPFNVSWLSGAALMALAVLKLF